VLNSIDAGHAGMFETEQVQILIVEADEAFRRTVTERLRSDGAVVFEAGNEPEARDIVQRHNIDVVLLGGKGIRQSGLPLLRLLKESQPMIEVILLSLAEHHSLYVSIEAMKLGAFDDILIPCDIKTLLDRIHTASRHKKEKEETMRRTTRGE
jgi:DNA-binding NtrC family response regulator